MCIHVEPHACTTMHTLCPNMRLTLTCGLDLSAMHLLASSLPLYLRSSVRLSSVKNRRLEEPMSHLPKQKPTQKKRPPTSSRRPSQQRRKKRTRCDFPFILLVTLAAYTMGKVDPDTLKIIAKIFKLLGPLWG